MSPFFYVKYALAIKGILKTLIKLKKKKKRKEKKRKEKKK